MYTIRLSLAAALLAACVLIAVQPAGGSPADADAKARAALALAAAELELAHASLAKAVAGSAETSPVTVPCGPGGSASGTAIQGGPTGSTWVVTNRHVARLGVTRVTDSAGGSHAATIVDICKTHDLAVLLAEGDVPAVPIAAASPVVGSKVWLRGNGNSSGGFHKLRTGTVSQCDRNGMAVAMWGSPGDSGSGFLDADGRLVGVLWGGPGANGANTCYGVPAAAVGDFVSRLPAARATVTLQADEGEPDPADGFLWGRRGLRGRGAERFLLKVAK